MQHRIALVRQRCCWLLLAFAILLVPACVTERSPVTGKKRFYGYSWEQEIALGQQADQQITQQLGLYDDPALQQYVDEVGQKVLAESDLQDVGTPAQYRETEFTFKVLSSPVVNAFALPGGYIYVTRGLLSHLQNEAQLAVILGHEIAHVAARHASRQALRAQAGQFGLMAGAILGSQVLESPGAMRNVLDLGGTVFQLLLTKYSRDAEREADQLGVKYAARDGYRVQEASEFFNSLNRIAEAKGARLPGWQSTHPDPGEREEKIKEMAAGWELQTDLIRVNQDRYLEAIEGMVLGDDPREGYVAGDTFYHPELQFRFSIPQNWQLQNERAAVLMMDPQRRAILVLELVAADTPQQAAQQLASQQKIQVVESTSTQINGLPAHAVAARAQAQQGAVAILSYFISHNGKVYNFWGYTSLPVYDQHRPVLESALRSFAPLTEPSRLQVQPARLQIIRADRQAPFRTFIPESLPPGLNERDLAIMNQVELNDIIEPAPPLKLPSQQP